MKKCYLRDEDGHPVTLIAYEVVGGAITYGMSTCHPGDVFDRAKGHLIAENRMSSRKCRMVCHRHVAPLVDIAYDIMRHGDYTDRKNTRWYQAACHCLTRGGFLPEAEVCVEETLDLTMDVARVACQNYIGAVRDK